MAKIPNSKNAPTEGGQSKNYREKAVMDVLCNTQYFESNMDYWNMTNKLLLFLPTVL